MRHQRRHFSIFDGIDINFKLFFLLLLGGVRCVAGVDWLQLSKEGGSLWGDFQREREKSMVGQRRGDRGAEHTSSCPVSHDECCPDEIYGRCQNKRPAALGIKNSALINFIPDTHKKNTFLLMPSKFILLVCLLSLNRRCPDATMTGRNKKVPQNERKKMLVTFF